MGLTIPKNLTQPFLLLLGALFLTVLPELANANLVAPSFIDTKSKQDIDAAGSNLMEWISIFFSVLTVLSLGVAAIFSVNGKMEEMTERVKNIMLGVIVFNFGATIVFYVFS